MTDYFHHILQLPAQCLVNQKITKAFFKRNFTLTRAERQLLDDAAIITGMDWMATLAPATTNIPVYRHQQVLVEEIQFIVLHTESENWIALAPRLAELVQKYIPYHIVLFISHPEGWILNTAEKTVNQNDASLRVLGRQFFSAPIPPQTVEVAQIDFIKSLRFAEKDTTHLLNVYIGYTQSILGLQAAGFAGIFIKRQANSVGNDVALLDQLDILARNIAKWDKESRQETQLNLQVQLNMQIQNARRQINTLTAQLID